MLQVVVQPTDPAPSAQTVLNLKTWGGLNNTDQGQTAFPSGAGRSVVLKRGSSVLVSGTNICEQDGTYSGGCSRGQFDDILNNFSETFDYPVASSTKVYSQTSPDDDECQLDFSLAVSEAY